jgi:hypothetical protein
MTELLLIAGGGFLAALVSGVTGFGFALAATALWQQWLTPVVATTAIVVLGTLLNVGYLPFLWREIDLKRFLPFGVGGAIGVPVGVLALRDLPTGTLRFAVGVVLVAYSAWALMPGRRPRVALDGTRAQVADGSVGLAGGFFGGLGGLCGFLPALWCGLRGFSKSEQRGVIQVYILAMNVLTMAWIGGLVGLDPATARTVAYALPAVALGGALGLMAFRRFDTATFNKAVLWTLLASGIVLVANGWATR